MSRSISRRDFLKLASASAATTAVLTGCGPGSRYVRREPYTQMPEYTYNGLSTYYATTCRECSAGCGLVVRTVQGRAIKVEGNKNNPVNLGKTCARGQVTLQGLYNPDRVTMPGKHKRGSSELGSGSGSEFEALTWDEAAAVVADALSKNMPDETMFLVGMAPDHLFDVVSELTKALGSPAPIRFGALGMFESRKTLMRACNDLFGETGLPFFDLGSADQVLSFGANFLETWLSPVAQTREFAKLRQGRPNHRGYFVHFEARMSQTASKADEWIALRPGSELQIVLAIGRLVAEGRGMTTPPMFAKADVEAAARAAGINPAALQHLADLFGNSTHPLAIPGAMALAQSNGLQTAKAILALNALVDNLGKEGGLFLSAPAPLADEYHRPASAQEMADLISKLNSGGVKTLFVHGVNPVFELPASFAFREALAEVSQVISFATFPDETAIESDYVFPDNQALESWGYQKIATGANQSVLSGAQPVVVPFVNSKPTVDVLLGAVQKMGGAVATALPYKDEVDFLRAKLSGLLTRSDGFFSAPEIDTFAAYFQQNGGWWTTADARQAPSPGDALSQSLADTAAEFSGEGDFHLVPFVAPTMAEQGANKPWLQEVPDPNTTVMWRTWIEMNPAAAEALGIDDQDVVRVNSRMGSLEATVYKYPGIRPDAIGVPFGQGHTAYGRFAAKRGVNPLDLLSQLTNESGDLAFLSMKVKVQKTGKKKPLSRMESALGVYGLDAKQ